mgnify:CR=1 FL=1
MSTEKFIPWQQQRKCLFSIHMRNVLQWIVMNKK